jgi:hypothetical protein
MMTLIDGSDPILSWWISLVAVVVVTAVVFVLLRLIIGKGAQIEATVAVIWARGQRVANNTIHIGTLYRTSDLVGAILGRVGRIAVHAKSIVDHAKSCPGCPQCLLDRGT